MLLHLNNFTLWQHCGFVLVSLRHKKQKDHVLARKKRFGWLKDGWKISWRLVEISCFLITNRETRPQTVVLKSSAILPSCHDMTWHEMFGINLDFDTYKHLIYPVCGLQKRTMPTFYSCYTDEDCDCCPPSLTLRPCWAPISLWTIGTTTKTCLNVNMDVWELFQGRLENCEPVL